MSTIRKLEDLTIWKEAIELGKWIYELTEKLPKSEEYNLKKHLRENARGYPANISEGFYRYFKKEKLHFYSIARGCLGEIKSDVCFCYEIYPEVFNDRSIGDYLAKIEKCGAGLNSFIKTTKFGTEFMEV